MMKNRFIFLYFGIFILLASNSFAQWEHIEGPYLGDITSFAFLGNNLFVGSSGAGVFISRDSGTTWTHVNNGLSNENLFINSLYVKDQSLYAITSKGIAVTKDSGSSWNLLNFFLPYPTSITSIGNILFVCTDNDIYRSSDKGNSWKKVTNQVSASWSNISAMASIGPVLLVSTTVNGIFRSINQGDSWSHIDTDIHSHISQFVEIKDSLIYATVNGIASGVEVSKDSGLSWKTIFSEYPLNFPVVSTICVVDSNIFVALYGKGVIHTSDNGISWNELDSGISNKNIKALIGSRSNLFAGTQGSGIFKSDSSGQFWIISNKGITNLQSNAIVSNGSHLFFGSNYIGIYSTTDYGDNWQEANNGLPYDSAYIYSFTEDSINIYATTRCCGVYKTSDNGANWIQINSGLATRTIVNIINVSSVLFITTNNGIYKSTNQGSSWDSVDNKNVNYLAVSNDIIFAVSSSNLYRTKNYGLSWDTLQIDTGEYSIEFVASLGDDVFITTYMNHLGGVYYFKSDDGGYTWKKVNINSTSNLSSIKRFGTLLFGSCELDGIFVSKDSGTNWVKSNDGLSSLFVNGIEISGNHLFAVINGTGVWRRSISDFSKVPEINISQGLNISLSPNPCRDICNVSFSLRNTEPTRILILDVLGKVIKDISIKFVSEGLNTSQIDFANLPNGIYFILVQSGSESTTNRLVLLR